MRAGIEAVDPAGAEVALGRDHVLRHFIGVLLGVGATAPQALFLVGERDHADRALRLERLEQRAGGHGDGDAGGVVDRAGAQVPGVEVAGEQDRSEEHTSELQSLMRISYAVFCLKKKKKQYSRANGTITQP